MTGLSECAEMVRAGDPDRFRDALFAPPDLRERLFALYAFNLELAKIAPMVSEPMLGEIRLQWWRESLDMAEAGTPRRHGVAISLAEAMGAAGLPRSRMDAIIDARGCDLDPDFPEDDAALDRYLRETAGALTGLGAKALEPALSARGLDAAEAAGFAIGAARYLLAVPRLASEAQRPVAGAHDWREALEGKPSEALLAALARLAKAGLAAAKSARASKRDVPRACAPALLELRTAEKTLNAAARAASLQDLAPPSAFSVQFGRLWRGATGRW